MSCDNALISGAFAGILHVSASNCGAAVREIETNSDCRSEVHTHKLRPSNTLNTHGKRRRVLRRSKRRWVLRRSMKSFIASSPVRDLKGVANPNEERGLNACR